MGNKIGKEKHVDGVIKSQLYFCTRGERNKIQQQQDISKLNKIQKIVNEKKTRSLQSLGTVHGII